MKSFREFINEQKYKLSDLSNMPNMLCGPASLKAFGIECKGDKVLKIHEIEQELVKSGYVVKSEPSYAFKEYTLGQFIKENKTGSYVLGTSNHVMSYIDGELTDTAHTKRALSKKLLHVIKVSK